MAEVWDAEEVKDRFRNALYILRRMPPAVSLGYRSYWPEILYTSNELMLAARGHRLLGPPSAYEISRLDEVLEWTFWLSTPEERHVIWMYAARYRWREICARLGCGRTKAHNLHKAALEKIAVRLNALEKER